MKAVTGDFAIKSISDGQSEKCYISAVNGELSHHAVIIPCTSLAVFGGNQEGKRTMGRGPLMSTWTP